MLRLTRRLALSALLIFFCGSARGITYPQLALGGGYDCVLIVTNKTPFAWSGLATMRRGNNLAWLGRITVNGLALPANKLMLELDPFATKKLAFTGDSVMRNGYLELEGTDSSYDGDVATSFFYAFRSSTGALLDSTSTPAADFSNDFMLPVEKSATASTAFAWSPCIIDDPFPIVMTLFNGSGAQVDQETVEYSGHKASFFDEIFTVPGTFVGMVRFQSKYLIYLTALRLETTGAGFQLTSVAPDDYIP